MQTYLPQTNTICTLQPLACYRIGIAVFCVISLLSLGRDFQGLFASNGLIDHQLLDSQDPSRLLSIYHFGLPLSYWQPSYLLLCLALAVGFLTKPASFLLLVLHASIFTGTVQLSYGVDYFCQIGLFYCLLFPVERQQSIDRQLFGLSPAKQLALNRFLTVLRLHLAIVYCFSGLEKALGPTWWNGLAIQKALSLPYFSGFFKSDVMQLPSLCYTLAGIAVLNIEILYPLLFFVRKARFWYLLPILLLHFTIGLVLGLYLFSLLMLFLNASAWLWDKNTTVK